MRVEGVGHIVGFACEAGFVVYVVELKFMIENPVWNVLRDVGESRRRILDGVHIGNI